MRYIVEDGINNIFTQFDFELLPFVAPRPIIREAFSPEFPVKTYPIYVQYADINGNVSRVYRSEIVVESFIGQYGLFVARPPFLEAPNGIDDDIITEANFLMGALVPPDAREMKIFEPGLEELATWQDALTVSEFIVRGDGENYDPYKELYVKFRDMNFLESPSFKRVFKMNIFPIDAPPLLLENYYVVAGQPANLLINPPLYASEMKIDVGNGVTDWLAIDGNYSIQPMDAGIQNLNITFRDALGNVSRTYQTSFLAVSPEEFDQLEEDGVIDENGTIIEETGREHI